MMNRSRSQDTLRGISISVALCTFNGAKYIEKQLESILNQDLMPDELIICDDASSDDTVQKISSYFGRTDCTIRLVVNTVNRGYTRNFENALSLATGDLIFLSDQDDFWHTNKISSIYELFESNRGIAGITHDGRLVDHDLEWYGTTKNGQIRSGYGPKLRVITGCLSAVRRTSLEVLLPIPVNVLGHDAWFTYIFSVLKNRWLHTDLCLQDIRRHSSNTSQWVTNSFKPINAISVLREQISSDSADSYADRRTMNQELTSRCSELKSVGNLYTQIELDAALCYLQNELYAINTRELIVGNRSLLRRCFISVRFWLRGGYQHFNGIKSLARDLLRN